MKTLAWTAGALLAAALPAAHAQDAAPADSFAAMDQSGDGSVNWDEFRNRMASLFHDLDKDDDKVLRGDENFPVYDAEGNEMPRQDVSTEEFMSAAEQAFMLADANGDGSLSRDEAAPPR
jgi:hypothetical protein